MTTTDMASARGGRPTEGRQALVRTARTIAAAAVAAMALPASIHNP